MFDDFTHNQLLNLIFESLKYFSAYDKESFSKYDRSQKHNRMIAISRVIINRRRLFFVT